jgi:hypothetical protein
MPLLAHGLASDVKHFFSYPCQTAPRPVLSVDPLALSDAAPSFTTMLPAMPPPAHALPAASQLPPRLHAGAAAAPLAVMTTQIFKLNRTEQTMLTIFPLS